MMEDAAIRIECLKLALAPSSEKTLATAKDYYEWVTEAAEQSEPPKRRGRPPKEQ